MRSIIADTGPLVALLSRNDRHHARVKTFLAGAPLRLLTTWPCITEAWHILHTRNRLPLMRWIAGDGLDVFDVRPEDVSELLDLLERYQDAAMDLADASLVLLASHIGIREILTWTGATSMSIGSWTGGSSCRSFPSAPHYGRQAREPSHGTALVVASATHHTDRRLRAAGRLD